MSTVELEDCCGEKATERVTDLLGDVETGNSFSELGLCIPCGEVVYGTGDMSEMSLSIAGSECFLPWKEDGLGDTENCSNSEKLTIAFDESRAS